MKEKKTGRVRLGLGGLSPHGPNVFARFVFLQAIRRCVPEAVRELAALPVAEDEFQVWVQRWHFSEEWMVEAARQTVARRDVPGCEFGSSVGMAYWEPQFVPGPSWNPLVETEEAFRARVEAYIASIKDMPGLSPTPEKRTTDARHFDWLALHHVKGLTYDEIATRYDGGAVDLSTISLAIRDAATLVGLTLRPGRGRRRS